MIKFNMEVYTFLSIGDGLVKNAAFKTQSLGSKRMKTIWDMVKYIGRMGPQRTHVLGIAL